MAFLIIAYLSFLATKNVFSVCFLVLLRLFAVAKIAKIKQIKGVG